MFYVQILMYIVNFYGIQNRFYFYYACQFQFKKPVYVIKFKGKLE